MMASGISASKSPDTPYSNGSSVISSSPSSHSNEIGSSLSKFVGLNTAKCSRVMMISPSSCIFIGLITSRSVATTLSSWSPYAQWTFPGGSIGRCGMYPYLTFSKYSSHFSL